MVKQERVVRILQKPRGFTELQKDDLALSVCVGVIQDLCSNTMFIFQ
jgi:hypothetical protein